MKRPLEYQVPLRIAGRTQWFGYASVGSTALFVLLLVGVCSGELGISERVFISMLVLPAVGTGLGIVGGYRDRPQDVAFVGMVVNLLLSAWVYGAVVVMWWMVPFRVAG